MSEHGDFRKLISCHGFRATAIRLALLEIIGAARGVMTASEILEELRQQRKVDKVTVYRILEEFSQRGIIRKLSIGGRACYYELACEHHPAHPHFQCQSCGEVQCLEPMSLERIWPQLKGPLGNLAEEIDIRVQGICHKCRGKC